MPYWIRSVTPEDLEAVTAVEQVCFPSSEAASREAFQARISTFPASFFVAQADDQVVGLINGCCTTTPCLSDALYAPGCPHKDTYPWQTVLGLAVLPDFQHQGIAKALMYRLIAHCRQQNKAGIILTCKQEKIGFYEYFGFLCHGKSASSHGGAVWYDMVLNL